MQLILEGRIIEWPKSRRAKGQTMNYKIFRRKLRIEQHEQHQENRMWKQVPQNLIKGNISKKKKYTPNFNVRTDCRYHQGKSDAVNIQRSECPKGEAQMDKQWSMKTRAKKNPKQ